LLIGAFPARADDGGVRVYVVAVLASQHSKQVDPKLVDLASEVRQKNKDWTGFRIGNMTKKSQTVGNTETFPLVDDQTATVTVERVQPDREHITLKVKSPELGDSITYTTVGGKYFPILTRYQTKEGEHLILAIMARTGKDK